MSKIAIVGFGFCGITTLYNLAFQNKYKEITIFEKSGFSTLGTAFSEFSQQYILNVPANNMSAFENLPDDFLQFLNYDYPNLYSKDDFVPRYIYGQYLQLIKEDAFLFAQKNSIKINIVEDEVLEIQKKDNNFLITTKSQISEASELVLATSFKQSQIKTDLEDKFFIKNLWDKKYSYFHQESFFLENKVENIFIVGLGLSAVDVIIGLKKRNYTGKIYAMSRRGNFPTEHLSYENNLASLINNFDAKKGVLFICKKIRKLLKENPNYELRNIIDSLRENAVELWHNLDEKNKKLFLKFLPYWNIYRHHVPIESMKIINSMIETGQIEIIKSSLKEVKKEKKILVKTNSEIFKIDLLVNCLGFEMDVRKYPLLNQMCEENLLKEDIFMCKSNDKKIHLLGGLNIGKDFESTSVPELRKHVLKLIQDLHS